MTGAAPGTRQAAVLERLAVHPGQTAAELGCAIGISCYQILRRLEKASFVVGVASRKPDQYRDVTRWHLAPSGPAGPSRTPASPSTGPACADADTGLFFPPEGERAADRHLRVARAKAVCAGCAVRCQCLELAADRGESWGIWGGTDLARASGGDQ